MNFYYVFYSKTAEQGCSAVDIKVMRSTPVAAAPVQADTRRHYALTRWRGKSLFCPAARPSATMRCSCHAVASPECRHERTGKPIPFRR